MALRLTMAFSDNPRVQPLRDGEAKPQGIELEWTTLELGPLFHRNLACDEFDVSEMSTQETIPRSSAWSRAAPSGGFSTPSTGGAS